MKYSDVEKLEIGMLIESQEYGIGTINNIWSYENKIHLSLKINDKLYHYKLFNKEDLKDLNFIKKKNNYYKQEIIEEQTQEDLDFRLKFPMKFHCIDGHYVRSPYEQQIDDFLTEQNIIHYYYGD